MNISELLVSEVYPQLSVEDIYDACEHHFKKSGERHRGGCPVHDSASGTSFVVTEGDVPKFWCEGCKQGGDPILYVHSQFVGRWENPTGRDFIKAARILFDRAGVPFPEREVDSDKAEWLARLNLRSNLLEDVVSFCREQLGQHALAYIQNRARLSPEQIADLEIGYYPSRHLVRTFLQERGYDEEEIRYAKVVKRNLEGHIIIPWRDERGRMLTLYGRYAGGEIPDYTAKTVALPNPKDPTDPRRQRSDLQTKRSPLYLDRALKAHHRDIVAVEGVFDAIVLQARGLTNVVAYVAASFSNAQIKTMQRSGIRSVTIVPDPDKGGVNGAAASCLRLLEEGIGAFVTEDLPDGMDPDEFILAHGEKGWLEHLKTADHGGRAIAAAEILKVRKDIRTAQGRDEALRAVADAVGHLEPLHIEAAGRAVEEFLGLESRVLKASLTAEQASGVARFSLVDFQHALEGRSGQEAQDMALDLIERCAGFSQADLLKAEQVLKRCGGTYDFRRKWRAAVKDTARQQAEEAEHEEDEQPITVRLAEAILADYAYARDAGEHLYVYDGGTYRRGGKEHIERRVKELLVEWSEEAQWSSYRASEVVKYIQADRPHLWDRPPADRINVINGILYLATKRLEPHTPDFLYPVQLPVEYDPEATCPQTEVFVSETYPEDAARAGVPWQLDAWLIDPAPSIQSALLFLGDGGNGKSRELMRKRALVGSDNTADMSLHFLESNRFATAGLHGMLANICPDLPSGHLAETSVFKAATGGDRLHGEYKHGNTFSFYWPGKLFFSANHPPRSSDSSEGFYRRWFVIPFTRTFPPEKRRPAAELDAALASEVSGVLNKALEWLPHVRRHGITGSASMAAALGDFRQVTDPFSVWADDHIVEHAEAYVPCEDLRRVYNKAAKDEGWPPMNKQTFGRRIREQYPNMERRKKVMGGSETWCYVGVGMRDKGSNRPDRPDNSFPQEKSSENGVQGIHTQNGFFLEKDSRNPVDPGGASRAFERAPYAHGEQVQPTGGAPGIVAGCSWQPGGGWSVKLTDGRAYDPKQLRRISPEEVSP